MTPNEVAKYYMDLEEAKDLLRKILKADSDRQRDVSLTPYYRDEINKVLRDD